MATHTTTWEDDDCSRIVQLSVDYQIADSGIEIERVTPVSIQFLDTDRSTKREIRIWTDKARGLLKQRYAQHVGVETLCEQIEAGLAVAAQ